MVGKYGSKACVMIRYIIGQKIEETSKEKHSNENVDGI